MLSNALSAEPSLPPRAIVRTTSSRFQRRRQAPRVVRPHPPDLAALEPQLDRVEAGHVVEPEARPHADAKTVPPGVAHDRDAGDLAAREPIAPQPGPEVPAQLLLAHLDGK